MAEHIHVLRNRLKRALDRLRAKGRVPRAGLVCLRWLKWYRQVDTVCWAASSVDDYAVVS